MILEVDNLHAHYGKSHVLQGVCFTVGNGELVTLLGRNGAGKTTTLKSIAGVVTPTQGRVTFIGKPLQAQASHVIARQGVCLVPEHRGIFKLLTVEENLMLGLRKSSPWQLDDVYRIFPRLKERRRNGGGQLSGGEQQMLAIGRALLTNPRLLILDEATEGLAPVIRHEIWACLNQLKQEGQTILLIDKNLKEMNHLVDRHHIIEKGRIVWQGTSPELMAQPELVNQYLGV